jgi:hypothetical protein
MAAGGKRFCWCEHCPGQRATVQHARSNPSLGCIALYAAKCCKMLGVHACRLNASRLQNGPCFFGYANAHPAR